MFDLLLYKHLRRAVELDWTYWLDMFIGVSVSLEFYVHIGLSLRGFLTFACLSGERYNLSLSS
jgi:hypothetical protein